MTLGDMIPQINADHEEIFIDSTLFKIPVSNYSPGKGSEAERRVIVLANDLKTIIDGDALIVVGNDLARVIFLEQGSLDESFIDSADKLQWDVLPIKGGYLVEYPIGHESMIQELIKHGHQEFLLDINIVSYSLEHNKSQGISFEQFLNFQISYFDIIHGGASIDDLVKGTGLFQFSYSRQNLETMLDGVITSKLSGQAGKISTQKIVSQVPYQVSSRNREGEVIRQDLEFIESGISISAQGFRVKEGLSFKFRFEVSNALEGNQDYPTVVRRSAEMDNILKVGETVEIARLDVQYKNVQKSSPFGKFFNSTKSSTDQETLVLLVKRTK
jgi:hypothetical protein